MAKAFNRYSLSLSDEFEEGKIIFLEQILSLTLAPLPALSIEICSSWQTLKTGKAWAPDEISLGWGKRQGYLHSWNFVC